ncbi:MAG: hypothetical protein WCF28_01750 [Methanobacterium sp.]
MKQTNIFAGLIVLACVFISITIVIAAYEQSQQLTKAQNSLKKLS